MRYGRRRDDRDAEHVTPTRTGGSGAPILFLRGNPTSSYVWRNVLPHVASQTGRRGIAPDLRGFGRSDKPDRLRYTLDLHARVVQQFVDALDLRDAVLVAEDWGGPLGMYDVVARSEGYRAAILMETFPCGGADRRGHP